jgi:hypothetical protein
VPTQTATKWIGYTAGVESAEYPDKKTAEAALAANQVDSIAPDPLAPSHSLFGSCSTARAFEITQPVGSDASEWHQICPGLLAQPRPHGKIKVAFCDCAHHTPGSLYRCSVCGARKPLDAEAGPDVPATATIDSRLGSCVDGVACAEMVAATQEASDLARQLRQIRMETRTMPKTDAATGTTERAPRTAKTGTCEHCGQPTRGGKFVPGHDAKLKGALARVYADRDASLRERTDALAEAIAREWLKTEAAHDITGLLRGVADADQPKVIETWERVLTDAKAKVARETAPKLLTRRTSARLADNQQTVHAAEAAAS